MPSTTRDRTAKQSWLAEPACRICTDERPGSETVKFTDRRRSYAIDLCASHAALLREELQPYVTAARRLPRHAVRRGVDRKHGAAVRAWARASGYQLADRGRIPTEIVEKYAVEHPDEVGRRRR